MNTVARIAGAGAAATIGSYSVANAANVVSNDNKNFEQKALISIMGAGGLVAGATWSRSMLSHIPTPSAAVGLAALGTMLTGGVAGTLIANTE